MVSLAVDAAGIPEGAREVRYHHGGEAPAELKEALSQCNFEI
jgi:hypothetical protein